MSSPPLVEPGEVTPLVALQPPRAMAAARRAMRDAVSRSVQAAIWLSPLIAVQPLAAPCMADVPIDVRPKVRKRIGPRQTCIAGLTKIAAEGESSASAGAGSNPRLRRLGGDQALALGALAGELAGAAARPRPFRAPSSRTASRNGRAASFPGRCLRAASSLERLERLVNVVVADENLHADDPSRHLFRCRAGGRTRKSGRRNCPREVGA